MATFYGACSSECRSYSSSYMRMDLPMTNRIDKTVGLAKLSGSKILAAFVTIGFPDVRTSVKLVDSIVRSGADLVELGVPFSDPLADGRTIQKTSLHALGQGVNVSVSLDVVRQIRNVGIEAPLVFLGYYNPFLQYGLDAFVRDAADVGVDGVIVPDLPSEESASFRKLCERSDMYLIPLLAPTSTEQRIALACKEAKGFIYCVSLAGVTGTRSKPWSGLENLVARIRCHTDLPILVGFGVSTRKDFVVIGNFADGVIVGSALLDAIDSAPAKNTVQAARDFIVGLKGDKKIF